MLDLRFLQSWRRVVQYKFTDVSEGRTVSSFRIEDNAEQATSKMRAASRTYFLNLKLEAVHSFETSVNF
jgi:hypothetical protein